MFLIVIEVIGIFVGIWMMERSELSLFRVVSVMGMLIIGSVVIEVSIFGR